MAFINYKERTVTANQIEGLLEIEFPYDTRLVELVRTLPDRKWNKSRSLWTTPLSEFHARKVIETLMPHDFDFDARVHRLAEANKKVTLTYFPNRDGLFPFQSEAVDFIHKQGGRVILADEMGLGKTVEALAWVRERPDLRKILIVCPASVVYKWERETKKWVGEDETVGIVTTGAQKLPDTRFYIMSYAIMVAKQQELRLIEWDAVVLDECFPGDTLVNTNLGRLRIDEIVNNKLEVFVESCNISANVVELKKVTGWIKKPLLTGLIKVTHECGSFICTDNHPIYTEEAGYVEANLLKGGETVRVLREEFPNKFKGEINGQILQSELCLKAQMGKGSMQRVQGSENTHRRKGLSVVWGQVYSSSLQLKKILWEKLFSKMEVESAGKSKDLDRESKEIFSKWGVERKKESQFFGPNEEEQSNVDAGSKRQDDSISQGENFPFSGWKRDTNTSTSPTPSKNRWSVRVCNWYTSLYQRGVRVPSSLLQGRYRIPRFKVGGRGGWSHSQTQEVEVSRQEKGSYTISSRVVSVEVYEPRDRRECGDGGTDYQFVYCLDVEDNHNFFADGVLVHNCHKIKSPNSQRSRSAMSLSYRYALLLTGTPLLNRPIELFPLLKYLNPGEWTDMFHYAMRYCDAHKNYFGWDFTGASNLQELRERIKTYMIRRTKKEVLDQLPELTRTRLPVKVKREEIKQALEELQVWVKENGGNKGARGETLVRLAKLRQAIGIAKVPVAVEIVEDILEQSESQKVVIYAVHHIVVGLLEQALKKWGVSTITGEVSQQDRQKRIDAFQNRHSPRVMVISSAGGEGIDLFKADKILFCEREWQPGTEEQAEARCHRMGQKNAVEAIYLIASDTVDCKMDMLIESKREVIGNLIKMDSIETHSNNSVDEFIKMIKEDK